MCFTPSFDYFPNSFSTRVVFLRVAQVILIHLSNLTGLDEEYSARTMNLLTSDQGTICFGVTAALCTNGWVKVRTVVTRHDMLILVPFPLSSIQKRLNPYIFRVFADHLLPDRSLLRLQHLLHRISCVH